MNNEKIDIKENTPEDDNLSKQSQFRKMNNEKHKKLLEDLQKKNKLKVIQLEKQRQIEIKKRELARRASMGNNRSKRSIVENKDDLEDRNEITENAETAEFIGVDSAVGSGLAAVRLRGGTKTTISGGVSHLTKIKDKESTTVPEARDFSMWKKRHGIDETTKVFNVTGCYPSIKHAFLSRGWYCNPDKTSPFFDYKWTLKSDELKHFKLEEQQYINHFMQNTAITTKVGLLHNLRSIVWHRSIDLNTFAPRGYDLTQENDRESFIDDFKAVVAEGLLKELGGTIKKISSEECQNIQVNSGVFDVIESVCKKRLEMVNDEYIDGPDLILENNVTDLQWEVLLECKIYEKNELGKYIPSFTEQNPDPSQTTEEKRLQKKKMQKQNQLILKERARIRGLLLTMIPLSDLVERIHDLLEKMQIGCSQFDLNGEFTKNVWIVKPAGMSRGRGIKVFSNLDEILHYVDIANHKESQWVVQKYIENPLIVCNRKFDIRQWVLVTSWNPLTIWFYKDCYFRFSVEEYHLDDLKDQFIHLTNNSISKYSDKFHQIYTTNDGEIKVEGNMWHSDEFIKFLQKQPGNENLWNEKIQPKMKQIVEWSLECAKDMVQHRKNSCELYGYDFMIDSAYNPWIIEVNSSPACDYSTEVTKKIVEKGLEGIIAITVDYRENELLKKKGMPSKSHIDTGRWELIHKGDYLPIPATSLGADFEVKGLKVKVKKTKQVISSTLETHSQFTNFTTFTNFANDNARNHHLKNNNQQESNQNPPSSSAIPEVSFKPSLPTPAIPPLFHVADIPEIPNENNLYSYDPDPLL